MAKQGFFGTSFNGYNKAEVIKYIEEQSAEIQKLNDQILVLKSETEGKSNKAVLENQRLKEMIASLEAGFDSNQNDKLKQAVLENLNLQEKISKLEAELAEKQAKEVESQPLEQEDDENKKKYYELCIRMGEKLLAAESTGQMIISKANEEAEAIIADAKSESRRLINDLVAEAKRQAEAVFEAVKLHKQKEYEIRDSLEVSLQKIRELIHSIEELGRTDD